MNKRYYLIIFVVAITHSYLTHGQECKFKRNEFDKTTSQFIRITEDLTIKRGFSYYCGLRFIQNDTSYFVKLIYEYGGFKHLIIDKDNNLVFTLDNDSVILHAVRSDTATTHMIGQAMDLLLTGKYSINKSDLILLSTYNSKKIKFITNTKLFEFDIPIDNQESLKSIVKCSLNP